MEPPPKRRRLSHSSPMGQSDHHDHVSHNLNPLEARTSGSEGIDDQCQSGDEDEEVLDPDFELEQKRAQLDYKLKSRFESIFEKYGRDFSGVGDEIDQATGEIVVNNGHLFKMQSELDVGIKRNSASGRFIHELGGGEDEEEDKDDGSRERYWEDIEDVENAEDGEEDDDDEDGEDDDDDNEEDEEEISGSTEEETDVAYSGTSPEDVQHRPAKDHQYDTSSDSSSENGARSQFATNFDFEHAHPPQETITANPAVLPSEDDILTQFGPQLGPQIIRYVGQQRALNNSRVEPAWRTPGLPVAKPAKRPLIKSILLEPQHERSPSPEGSASVWGLHRELRAKRSRLGFTQTDRNLILEWVKWTQKQGYRLWGAHWNQLEDKAPHHNASSYKQYYRKKLYPRGVIDVSMDGSTQHGTAQSNGNDLSNKLTPARSSRLQAGLSLATEGKHANSSSNDFEKMSLIYTEDDDALLIDWYMNFYEEHRRGVWSALAQKAPHRNSEQWQGRFRHLRDIGVLDPSKKALIPKRLDIRLHRSQLWTKDEDAVIIESIKNGPLSIDSSNLWHQLQSSLPGRTMESFHHRLKNLRRSGRIDSSIKISSTQRGIERVAPSVPKLSRSTPEGDGQIIGPQINVSSVRKNPLPQRPDPDLPVNSRPGRVRQARKREPGTVSWSEAIEAVRIADPTLHADLLEDMGNPAISDRFKKYQGRGDLSESSEGDDCVPFNNSRRKSWRRTSGTILRDRAIEAETNVDPTRHAAVVQDTGVFAVSNPVCEHQSDGDLVERSKSKPDISVNALHLETPYTPTDPTQLHVSEPLFTKEEHAPIIDWESESKRREFLVSDESTWNGLARRAPSHSGKAYFSRYITLQANHEGVTQSNTANGSVANIEQAPSKQPKSLDMIPCVASEDSVTPTHTKNLQRPQSNFSRKEDALIINWALEAKKAKLSLVVERVWDKLADISPRRSGEDHLRRHKALLHKQGVQIPVKMVPHTPDVEAMVFTAPANANTTSQFISGKVNPQMILGELETTPTLLAENSADIQNPSNQVVVNTWSSLDVQRQDTFMLPSSIPDSTESPFSTPGSTPSVARQFDSETDEKDSQNSLEGSVHSQEVEDHAPVCSILDAPKESLESWEAPSPRSSIVAPSNLSGPIPINHQILERDRNNLPPSSQTQSTGDETSALLEVEGAMQISLVDKSNALVESVSQITRPSQLAVASGTGAAILEFDNTQSFFGYEYVPKEFPPSPLPSIKAKESPVPIMTSTHSVSLSQNDQSSAKPMSACSSTSKQAKFSPQPLANKPRVRASYLSSVKAERSIPAPLTPAPGRARVSNLVDDDEEDELSTLSDPVNILSSTPSARGTRALKAEKIKGHFQRLFKHAHGSPSPNFIAESSPRKTSNLRPGSSAAETLQRERAKCTEEVLGEQKRRCGEKGFQCGRDFCLTCE